jgi:hypothetical protein
MAILALAFPASALAAGAPALPGQAVGRSALPAPVEEGLAKETGAAGAEIGRLRLQKRGGQEVYSAELLGPHPEVVTLDAKGNVVSRAPLASQ